MLKELARDGEVERSSSRRYAPRGALPEVVADGIGGRLVVPDDEDALLAAVPDALALDRAAVRSRARRELGVAPMVDAYQRLLRSAASAAGPVARAAG